MATKKVENKGLLSKLKGVKEAYGEHKGDKTTYSNAGELPPGIENGFAELIELAVDEYKNGKLKGQPYFKARGIVRHPKTHNDVKCSGKQTIIMEPLCETPGRSRESVDAHVEWMLNELRKLGMETDSIPFEKLESVMAAYAESGVIFTFRTWAGEPSEQYPNPVTNHQWQGVAEESELPEDLYDTSEVEDGTETVEEEEEPKPEKKPVKKPKVEEPEPEPEEEPETEAEVEDSDSEVSPLNALAEKAEEGDKSAQKELLEQGLAKGIDEDLIENAEDWYEVVKLIEGEGETTQEVEEEKIVPTKGQVYLYHPVSKTTGKPLSKGVECEVTKVNTKEEICDLKNLSDQKKTYKSVPFDKLVSVD